MRSRIWIGTAAVVIMALSDFLAQTLVVDLGWRWTYLVSAPFDGSRSILSYWLMIGALSPIVLLFGAVMLWSSLKGAPHLRGTDSGGGESRTSAG